MILLHNHVSDLTLHEATAGPWAWLTALFRRPLELTLSDRRHHFARPGDFDFCLRARTAVPPLRLSELFARAAAELHAEAVALHDLEQRLTGMLEDDATHGISISVTLRRTGVKMFSKDYEWRSIFTQLVALPRAQQSWVRIAVSRYVEYLAARQDVLEAIARLQATPDGAAARAELRTSEFEPGELMSAGDSPAAQRLPRGRAVMLRLEPGREVAIRLARHAFALSHGRQWALIADSGQRYTLHPGVNSIGRSRDNDVQVDGSFRNVSRQHLLAEPLGSDLIVLTDVSSCGTFVPASAIAS